MNENEASPGSSAVLQMHLPAFQSHAWSYDHIAHHGALEPRSPPAHTEPASLTPEKNTPTTRAYFYPPNIE